MLNFKQQVAEHQLVFDELQSLEVDLKVICKLVLNSLVNGGKILFCGNGGSAADSQHLAAEFLVRFEVNREPISAMALTVDTSTLTATGNDFSFNKLFDRQIKALGREGDVLIAISTSGNSKNILSAVQTANKLKLKTVGFLGNDGGRLKNLCHQSLIIPSNKTARIQEAHIFLGHFICGYIEEKFKDV